MAKLHRLPDFKRVQYAFTAHLRDPVRNPPPMGIEDRRMKLYRELLYNNVEGFIANGFPVLRGLYDDHAWHRLIRDFFSRHRSRTPYFHGIGKEFLDYLQTERAGQAEDPLFLLELAHYEWAEMALSISEIELDLDGVNECGDMLEEVPVLSPLAWPVAYQYPVHRISVDFRPSVAPSQPTYIVVYRGRDDQVGFLEVNAVTARLLQLMESQPELAGRQQLQKLAQELEHPKPEVVVKAGQEMLEGLRQRDIILGVRSR